MGEGVKKFFIQWIWYAVVTSVVFLLIKVYLITPGESWFFLSIVIEFVFGIFMFLIPNLILIGIGKLANIIFGGNLNVFIKGFIELSPVFLIIGFLSIFAESLAIAITVFFGYTLSFGVAIFSYYFFH